MMLRCWQRTIYQEECLFIDYLINVRGCQEGVCNRRNLDYKIQNFDHNPQT